MSGRAPVAAAGIVCFRGAEVLLVRRATAPLRDAWSLPGGRIEWGETARNAALRELKEETGIDAEIIGLVDVVDAVFTRRAPENAEAGEAEAEPWAHYVLIDFAARWTAGEPRAGDDAADARFFSAAELGGLGLWDETVRVIDAARALLARS